MNEKVLRKGSVHALPFIFYLFLLTLSGCRNAHMATVPMSVQPTESPLTTKLEYAKKYSDIAMAVNATDVHIMPDPQGNTEIQYQCHAEFKKIVSLYTREMATHGWHLVGQTQTPSIMLVFEKPTRSCIITLTNQAKKGIKEMVVTVHIVMHNGNEREVDSQ